MGESDLLLGPHEQSIGGIGDRTNDHRRGGLPYAPYASDAFPPLRDDEKSVSRPSDGPRATSVLQLAGTGAGGFVLTREEPGKWGTRTYSVVRT